MNRKIVLLIVALILISSVNAFTFRNDTEVECDGDTTPACNTGKVLKTFNFTSNPINVSSHVYEIKTDGVSTYSFRTIFTYEDDTSSTVLTDTFSLTFVNITQNNPTPSKLVKLIEVSFDTNGAANSMFGRNNIVTFNRFGQNQWAVMFEDTGVLAYSLILSNSSGVFVNTSTTNGTILSNFTGNYTANITSDSFANFSQLFDIVLGLPITVNLTAQKALILDILDEETDQIITDENLTITIVGSTGAFVRNFTTDTGEISITNITLDDYVLTYGGGKYRFRTRFVTVTIDSQNLTLYTVRNTSSSLILFIVTDEKSKPVTNGTLTVSRFFVNKAAFLPVGQERTDDNGETAMYLVPNDVFYRFTIQKGGQVLFTALERKIFSSIVKVTFPVLDDVIQSMGVIRNTFTNLSFNNDTNIVEFFWLSTSDLVETGCVQVLEKRAVSQVLFGPVCASSTTATVTINLTGSILNDTLYLAQGFIETNTTFSTYYTDQIEIYRAENFERFGLTGLFFSWIFIVAMFFLGIPVNFTIALIYTIVSSIVVQAMGISYLSWTLIISFSIIGFVIATVTKQ